MPRLLRQQPGSVGQYFDGPIRMDGVKAVHDGKIVRELHDSTCAHCQHGTEIPNIRHMMDYVEICRSCMRLICLTCYDRMCRGLEGCVPAEERADREEREAELKAKIERETWRCY